MTKETNEPEVEVTEESEDQGGEFHIAAVIKVRDFSMKDKHSCLLKNLHSPICPYVIVYANGESKEHVGYVCVIADFYRLQSSPKVILISLIDSSGNHRFSQTHTRPPYRIGASGDPPAFHWHITRKILLDDAADLLPDDTLTLSVEIYSVPSTEEDLEDLLLNSCVTYSDNGERVPYLHLDTLLAKKLAEESTYFERLLQTPMIEQTTRRVRIQYGAPVFEARAFGIIGMYLLGTGIILCPDIEDIFRLFIVADKYDIPIITEVSLCFLKLCLSDHDARDVRERAKKYLTNAELVGLWEMLDDTMRMYWGAGDSNEGDGQKLVKVLERTQEIRGRIWTYRHNSEASCNLYFTIDKEKPLEEKKFLEGDHEASFDFYS